MLAHTNRIGTIMILLTLIVLDSIFIYLSTTVDRTFIAYTDTGLPYSLSPAVDWHWLLEGEGSYGEIFQYVKEAVVALSLLVVFLRTRAPLASIGAILFGSILLDDLLAIHERIGFFLKQNMAPLVPLFRWQSVNEAIFFATLGGLFTLFSARAYRHSSYVERQVAHIFLVLLALLALSGIGFDLLHALFKSSQLLPILEDGGEMLTMSALLTVSLALCTLTPRAAHILHQHQHECAGTPAQRRSR